MFHPTPAPFAASLAGLSAGNGRLLRRVEWLFAVLALVVAGLGCAGFGLVVPQTAWDSLLKLASAAILVIALPGMWVIEQITNEPLSSAAVCWAAIQDRVRTGFLPQAVCRTEHEPPSHALAAMIADVILQLRRLQAGRLQAREVVQSTNRKLQAGRDEARQLALAIRSDGAGLSDAASGIMLASARLSEDTAATLISADATERDMGAATDRASSLAGAVRTTTAEIGRMTEAAIKAADASLAAQRHVAALDQRSEALAQAADLVGRTMKMAAVFGQAAGVSAARSGADGRGGADLAANLQQMAASADQGLSALQQSVAQLRVEAGEASRRVAELCELIQAQNRMGQAVNQAVTQQGEEIGAMLHHLSGAHAGFATLRAGVEAVTRSSTSSLAGAEAVRGAANRLPSHADAITGIMRGMPDFAPPLEF